TRPPRLAALLPYPTLFRSPVRPVLRRRAPDRPSPGRRRGAVAGGAQTGPLIREPHGTCGRGFSRDRFSCRPHPVAAKAPPTKSGSQITPQIGAPNQTAEQAIRRAQKRPTSLSAFLHRSGESVAHVLIHHQPRALVQ